MSVILVLCTFPDLEKARQIGTVLVEKQLAACVNLLPAIESIYRWEGKVEQATEVLGIFKTTREAYPRFRDEMATSHPYEVPEIIALNPEDVAGLYARWVGENVL